MRRRAFTLIELLVIIGIIAVLIAILIPTLGAVYSKGYKTRTQTIMNDVQSGLASYYAHFNAYAGPAGSGMTAPVTAPPAASRISGAQNLLLGLSYSLVGPGGTLPTSIAIVPPGPPLPPVTTPRIVTDYSSTNPDGTHSTSPAYFNPVLPNGGGGNPNIGMATTGGASGFTGNASLPVVIDAYSDSLPILYYRRTPGVSAPAAQAATTSAAYYVNDNIEYTGTTQLYAINANTGTAQVPSVTFDQTTGGLSGASAATYLNTLVTTDHTATGPVHGGYLLIDAGPDRIFGTADDIVIVGGD